MIGEIKKFLKEISTSIHWDLKRCSYCHFRRAKWYYGPDCFTACHKCVPRGCYCNHARSKVSEEYPEDFIELPPKDRNWKWVDEEKGIWTPLDEEGREYPCVDWMSF